MKSRLFSFFATAGAFAACCLHTSSAEAIFASAKSTGMGGTAYAYPLDTFAGAYNPAGLPDVGDRIDVEAAWVYDGGSATVSQEFTEPEPALISRTYNGMRTTFIVPVNGGINKNWQIGCSDWTVSTGLILYNRAYQKTTYKDIILTPYPPGFAVPLLGITKPGLEYLNETVAGLIGVQWAGVHTLAVSIDYQVERLKVNGIENFIPSSLFPTDVTDRGYEYATGWGATIGYQGHITPDLTIGVAYQPEVTMTKMAKYQGFLAGGRLNIPRRIGGGISYKILPCLVAAFDVEQLQWSKVRPLHNPLTGATVVDGIPVTVPPLGAKDGPGFGFRDQVYYRVGIEWTINECWAARLGFRYANTPIRSSQTAVNILTLDLVESYITGGATWNISESNEVTIVGAYGFGNRVSGTDSIPEAFGGGNVSLREKQKYAVGLAWGYHY